MRSRSVVTAFVLALALVAAGCGGSDDEEDPTTAWAAGFCTAITDWTDAIEGATTELTSNPSEDALRSAADDVRTATDQFVDDIRGLGAPETESGDEIESAINGASTTIENESASIEEAVDGISNLTELPGAITTITTSLSAMGTAAASVLQAIQDADVDGELQSALEDSPECAGVSS
jgi:hypothetical protein